MRKRERAADALLVDRSIVAYHQDDLGDWVAELDCLHDQHVRNQPPFINRPWAATAAGRESHLGARLPCLRCDRLEWPDHLVPYKQTPEFTESTIPHGLLTPHATKRGVWGRIKVTAGTLQYIVESPEPTTFEIIAGGYAAIAPGMLHRVAPIGNVRFVVAFYGKPAAAG